MPTDQPGPPPGHGHRPTGRHQAGAHRTAAHPPAGVPPTGAAPPGAPYDTGRHTAPGNGPGPGGPTGAQPLGADPAGRTAAVPVVVPRRAPAGPPSDATETDPLGLPASPPDLAPATAGVWAGAAPVAAPGPVVGHGHGHGHSPAPPSGRPVRILIAALLGPCALATLIGVLLLWPAGGAPTPPENLAAQPVRATVTQATASDCSPGSGDGGCLTLLLAMADGPMPGRDLVQVVPVEPSTPRFAVGDEVIVGWSGADPLDPSSYQVTDFQRDGPLIWLAVAFAAAVLLLGRWRGLAALAALGLTFVVLLGFVLPAILAGSDPLGVAVVGSGLIMFTVLYLTHGLSARTSVAVLGTLLSLATIAALGALFSAAASLTGLDDQTTNLIASLGTPVDARGLLLAGVVIGALGVLDDVTVTQTSAVWELRRANPALGVAGLFGAAMRIGRDHVASAVNTLVLAYAGASLPLMLLFSLSGRGLGEVVTTQDVATEVVRTLVGSIGLVASVPITTWLAAAVASREQVPTGAVPTGAVPA